MNQLHQMSNQFRASYAKQTKVALLCQTATQYEILTGAAVIPTTLGGTYLGSLGVVASTQACFALCDARTNCEAVRVDYSMYCYGYTTTPAMTTALPYSTTYQNICKKLITTTTTLAPTTTVAATTTTTVAPPQVSVTTIAASTLPSAAGTIGLGSSGKCPDPFNKANATIQIGGTLMFMMTTEAFCLESCYNLATCISVDFNYQTGDCYTHTTNTVASQLPDMDCCAHFSKITCGPKCYSHVGVATPVATTDFQQVVIPITTTPATTEMACSQDLCVTNVVVDLGTMMYTTTRGCEATKSAPDPVCDTTTDLVLGMITLNCVCKGNRCNSLGGQLPAAYYPLDCNLEDYGGFSRTGANNGDLVFESVDVARNWSAKFDGVNDFISVQGLAGVRLGSAQTTDGTLGSVTVAFWMKRDKIDGRMAMFNTGMRNLAPIEIISTAVDNLNHKLSCNFRVGPRTYTASGNGYTFNWHFVACVLARDSTDMVTTTLYVTNTSPGSTDTTTVTSAAADGPKADLTPAAPLNLGNQPLMLGAVNDVNIAALAVQAQDFLFGYMDEVYIFNTALSLTQLQAVHDTTRPVA